MTDTDNLNRRRFLQATGGAASAVALAGCTGGNDDSGNETTTTDSGETTTEATTEETTEDSSDQEGKYLNLTSSTLTTLDPIASTDAESGEVIQQIHEPLMNYPNSEIAVEPRLATGYEVSEDLTTYTFNIKENATFHNGDPITASDLKYAWERLAASGNSRRAYFILDSIGVVHETETVTQDGEEVEQYKPGSMAVTAVDEKTVEIELSQPFHSILEMMAYTSFAAVPEGIVGDIEGYEGEISQDEFAKNPVGGGPFKFENWQPNDQAEVSRYEDYHGEVPKVAGVHWNIMSDANAKYNYVMNKNADVFGIPTSKFNPDKMSIEETDDKGRKLGTYGPARNGETLNFGRVATIDNYYIGFNMDKVEKPVRQAFAYAANHETAAQEIFKGTVQAASHFVPPAIFPGGPSRYEEHGQNYPYGNTETRLDKARQVMKDAGYGPDNKAEVTITAYQESPVFQETAKLLRDKLASAHLDITVEVAPFATMTKRGRNGKLEAYTLGWIMDWPAPDNFLQLLYPPRTDTSKSGPSSYINWEGTEAAEQATSAWETISNNGAPTEEATQARNEAYIQMEEANWEDMMMLPLFHSFSDRMWYDWADIQMFGGAGDTRQMYNTVEIGERN